MNICALPGCNNPLTHGTMYCSRKCAAVASTPDRGICQADGCNNPLKKKQRVACSRECASRLGYRTHIHPEELRERVRELWTTDLSCAGIGRQVGLTKNAVVGLCKRMGLPGRPNPVKTTLTPEQQALRRERQIAAQQAMAGAKALAAAKKVSVPRVRPAVVVAKKETPSPVPIRRLVRGPCQWVGGDKRRWTFCDADATVGSYCDEHGKICYVTRRQVQEAA